MTRLDTDSNLGNDINVWLLEYRIKPENPDKVVMAGGMRLEDGWITEWGSTGQPYLVLVRHTADESWVRVGVTNTLTVTEDYGGNYSQAAVDMYNKYLSDEKQSSAADISGNAMYMLFDSGKSLAVGLNIAGKAYNTYTTDNRWYAERFVVLMNIYNWTKTDMPGTAPSNFQLTVSSADGSACFTYWQGGDAETVQYVDGGETTYWLVTSKYGNTIGIAEAMRAEYDNMDVDCVRISFDEKGTAEKVTETFVKDVYADHLLDLEPSGIYSISDYEVVDWGVNKVSDNKAAILGWVKFAVIPQDYNSAGLWAGNTVKGTGKYEGWLVMSREFVLQKQADGYWHCIDLGTGGASLPED